MLSYGVRNSENTEENLQTMGEIYYTTLYTHTSSKFASQLSAIYQSGHPSSHNLVQDLSGERPRANCIHHLRSPQHAVHINIMNSLTKNIVQKISNIEKNINKHFDQIIPWRVSFILLSRILKAEYGL